MKEVRLVLTASLTAQLAGPVVFQTVVVEVPDQVYRDLATGQLYIAGIEPEEPEEQGGNE